MSKLWDGDIDAGSTAYDRYDTLLSTYETREIIYAKYPLHDDSLAAKLEELPKKYPLLFSPSTEAMLDYIDLIDQK
jgi:hypothetical protein